MGWINLLERAFGDKHRKPEKGRRGQFEKALLESKAKKDKIRYDRSIKEFGQAIEVRKKAEKVDQDAVEHLSYNRKKLIDEKLRMKENIKDYTAQDYLAQRLSKIPASSVISTLRRPRADGDLYERKQKEYLTRFIEMGYIYNFNQKDVGKKVAHLKTRAGYLGKPEQEIEEDARFLLRRESKEIRHKQMDSLIPWLMYLRNIRGADIHFVYFVLRSVLKYDLYWLDKNEDGTWRAGTRDKSTKKEFPIFDADMTPEVLAKMRERLAVLEFEPGRLLDMVEGALPEFQDDSPIYNAIKNGDFRELYYLTKEEIEISRVKDEDIESREVGKWLPVYSYKDCGTPEEKKKMARELSRATEYSRGFCIKSPITADTYLSKGNVYLYSLKTTVRTNKDKTKVVPIPEIAIHIFNDGNINGKEIHGNAPNQGIKKEFLPVAEKFVAESNFKNKDQFENKFADAYIYENIKEKIEKDEALDKRELAFLRELYRKVELFDILNAKGVGDMDRLRSAALTNFIEKMIGRERNRTPGELRTMLLREHYSKIFEVSPEEILFHPYQTQVVEISQIPKNTKVLICNTARIVYKDRNHTKDLKYIVGDLYAGGDSRINLQSIEEVTGVLREFPTMPIETLKNLKKVSGIVLTEKDRKDISQGLYISTSFPSVTDSRIEKFKY